MNISNIVVSVIVAIIVGFVMNLVAPLAPYAYVGGILAGLLAFFGGLSGKINIGR